MLATNNEMATVPTLQFDLQQYYPAKAMFEEVLGHNAFMRVKDYGSLAAWKDNYARVLKALGLAIRATVQVADQEWRDEVDSLLALGRKHIDSARSIDDLHASVAATVCRLSFLQVGHRPSRRRSHIRSTRDGLARGPDLSLVLKNWKLDYVRSVQYVQSDEQKAMQAESARRRKEKAQDRTAADGTVSAGDSPAP